MRLATAAVVAPLLLLLLFYGPSWGWSLLIFVATGIAALELLGMTHPDDRTSRLLGTVITITTCVCAYRFANRSRLLLVSLSLLLLSSLLVPVWRTGAISTAALRLSAGAAIPFYLGVPLATLALLRHDLSALGPPYVLLVLMLAWLGDTGAYFVGRRFGRTSLSPLISPKKTREGLVGAILGAVGGGLCAHYWYLPELPLLDAVGLGLVAGVFGQLGDLVESLLKRSTGIKDSGQIIPGHGGLLDRIDALLFVSPIVYAYVLLR